MNEHLIGAASPYGVTKTTSYQLTEFKYYARYVYAPFTASNDLSRWVPEPLKIVDPHAGFIKAYEYVRRPANGPVAPPTYTRYNEFVVSTRVTYGDDPAPRQFNLCMWLDRDWAVYQVRETLGWPKKRAEVTIAEVPRVDDGTYNKGSKDVFYACDVSRHGFPVATFRAEFGDAPPIEVPPFEGFYSIRNVVSQDGTNKAELLAVGHSSHHRGEHTYGTATLSFGSAPDEEPDQFGEIEVHGAAMLDMALTFTGLPARRIAELPDFHPQLGDAQPLA